MHGPSEFAAQVWNFKVSVYENPLSQWLIFLLLEVCTAKRGGSLGVAKSANGLAQLIGGWARCCSTTDWHFL